MNEGATTTKTDVQVIRVADWRDVENRVTSVGGQVLRVIDDSIMVIEVPRGISAASVGAEEVLERRLSPEVRAVTSNWRRVEAA